MNSHFKWIHWLDDWFTPHSTGISFILYCVIRQLCLPSCAPWQLLLCSTKYLILSATVSSNRDKFVLPINLISSSRTDIKMIRQERKDNWSGTASKKILGELSLHCLLWINPITIIWNSFLCTIVNMRFRVQSVQKHPSVCHCERERVQNCDAVRIKLSIMDHSESEIKKTVTFRATLVKINEVDWMSSDDGVQSTFAVLPAKTIPSAK